MFQLGDLSDSRGRFLATRPTHVESAISRLLARARIAAVLPLEAHES